MPLGLVQVPLAVNSCIDAVEVSISFCTTVVMYQRICASLEKVLTELCYLSDSGCVVMMRSTVTQAAIAQPTIISV